MLRTFNPLLILRRYKKSYIWKDEGIQYPGFKYYPRHKDFKDPPYEPTKLFRVKRIKPLKSVPHYEREILKGFGLDVEEMVVKVVKNIPENNQRLWRVKHLIEIAPITFPDGFPKDINGAYLKENGELSIIPELVVTENKLEATDKFLKKPERFDTALIRRDCRYKWLSGWE